MPPHRVPGPICKTRECHESIDEGTLARTSSPTPPVTGSSEPVPEKPTTKVIASGQCTFLVPGSSYTVKAPKSAFDRLRKASGEAKISNPKPRDASAWPNGLSALAAVEQEIEIDGQKIQVIRPSDDEIKVNQLPTMKELAEALRAVPKDQRAHTRNVVLSPVPSPKSTKDKIIAGEGGDGAIFLFPLKDDKQVQTQEDFDNRVMHECGHNYQDKFWHLNPDAMHAWQSFADADEPVPITLRDRQHR